MEQSYAEIEKICEEYERNRRAKVSELVINDVMKKVSALGWPMHRNNILIGWHFEFVVIDFVHKPSDFFSILTPIRIWEEGGTDPIYEQAFERRFSKS